ncbi:MAG: ABC transporter ATP-binding protein, partial [Clostridiales bacterium]|nr:ABC transporter ATP-binding protein [Clostridiales bacterium]
MKEKLLEVKNLSVAFKYDGKFLPQTRDVSFDIYKGEILGLVGESGSGKSVTSKVLLQLLPPTGSKILSGEAIFEGEDLVQYPRKKMYNIRGNKISMVFQEPMTSLNPVYTCGNQIEEAIMLHQKLSKKEARKKAIEMMEFVGIPLPESRIDNYPHEMSGGMRQRVMIAMALSCNPKLLIADEPTTALDPTIQAQIMDLLVHLQRKTGMSVLYISHDLGVIAEICDRVAVMYAGTIMEIADVHDLFYDPWHPYTIGLLNSMPRMDSTS